MATSLVHLPDIERLSSRVIRILGGNPGKFTLQGTNTYLIGQGPSRLLIDTGEGKPAWLTSLKSVLTQEQASISHVLLTHWHPDHVSGVSDLLTLVPSVKIHKNQPCPSSSQLEINHGQVFETQGATLKAFYCPGHTTDHMAFVLDEEDAMFTGDNVLGHGTAVFEDLTRYMESLQSMGKEFGGRAYPGHGAVIEDGRAKIHEYIRHRKERENQILEVLARKDGGGGGGGGGEREGWRSMDVVKVVYKDVPESLHAPAEKGVLQVLKKLKEEGRVGYDASGELWTLVSKSAL